jgi:hypothetical protein
MIFQEFLHGVVPNLDVGYQNVSLIYGLIVVAVFPRLERPSIDLVLDVHQECFQLSNLTFMRHERNEIVKIKVTLFVFAWTPSDLVILEEVVKCFPRFLADVACLPG